MATDDLDIRVAVKNARGAETDLKRVARAETSLGTAADKAGRKGQVAGRRLTSMGKASRFAGSRMRSAVGGAIALAGAYIGIAKAKDAVTTTEELAKSTLGLKKATGLETEQASRWVNVAKVRGVQSKALMMGFGTLARNMTAATEAGSTQADTFKKLGVSHAMLKRGDMQEVLGGMAQGFKALGETPERTAAGMTLMGRGWQSLLPIMRDGKKGMQDLLGASDEMGATMSDKTVEQTMELVTAQRELQLGMLGLKVSFTKAVTPALTDLANTARDAIKVMNDPNLTSEEKVRKVTDLFADVGDRLGDGLKGAHVGEILTNLFEDALPRMAEAAGRGGGKLALAFVKGWAQAGWVGKLFVAAVLLRRVGLFSFLGKTASKKFIIAFAPRLAAAMGVEMAAGGTIGGAVAGSAAAKARWRGLGGIAARAFAAGIIGYGLYKALEDPFNQAMEDLFGQVNASDPTNGEAQRRADERAGNAPRSHPHRNSPYYDYNPNRSGIQHNPPARRPQSLTNPRVTAGPSLSPEVVVPVSVQLRDKTIAEGVGRAKLRDEALSGRRWGAD